MNIENLSQSEKYSLLSNLHECRRYGLNENIVLIMQSWQINHLMMDRTCLALFYRRPWSMAKLSHALRGNFQNLR